MTSKKSLTNLKILKEKNVEKEIMLFLILEMVHNGDISLNKAYEMCTEYGMFSDHWIVIDAKATEIFSKIYEPE